MLKWIFSILIGMLLILSIMFGRLVIGSDLTTDEKISKEDPGYHLQLIVQNTDEYFWTDFQKGAKEAQEELGVYVELVKISQRNVDDLREAVEMGVNAGVDGIGLQAADSEQTQEIIDQAKEQGISVLTYENGNYNIPNTPMVGTNSYSLGYKAGEMAVKASGGQANMTIIVSNEGNKEDQLYNNLIVQGILDATSMYSTMNINKEIKTINTDIFEAEKIATSIIEDKEKVNFIICIDERSTPGIAQILVDNNKVGDIKLIGYGIMPQTLDYIDRRVIYGTVCPNAYEIGYTTVKQLVQSLNGEQISDSISTELYTIDKNNVKQYIQQMEQD